MEPYAHAAFGRIWLFLDDLNLVFGCLPAMPPIGPLDGRNCLFDQLGLQPQFFHHTSNMTVRRGRLTRRSKSWRKKHMQPVLDRPRQSSPACADQPVYSSKRRAATIVNDVIISKPETRPVVLSDVQPDNQASSFATPNLVQMQVDAYDSTNPYASNYHKHSDQDAVDQSGPQFLESERNAEDQSDSDPHLLEDNQEPNDPQVQEPVFDMKNYCANDFNRWASTLTAEEFEELRHQGKEAWIDAFQQYITSGLDHPTSNSPQLGSLPHNEGHQQQPTTNNCPDHHSFHPLPDYTSDATEGIDNPNHLDYNENFHGNQAFESDGGYNGIDDAGGKFNDPGNLEDVWNDHLDYGNDFDGLDGFDNGGYEDYDDGGSDVFDGDGFIYH
jgi:hypothetical protein